MEEQGGGEPCAWILKPPYGSHSKFFHYTVSSLEIAIARLQHIVDVMNDGNMFIIPYMMMQRALSNRKEYKIVLHNGVAQYISSQNGSNTSGHAFGTVRRRKAFAEKALQILKNNCPEAEVDGLVRVDIMSRGKSESEWAVNEFETYGAGIFGKGVDSSNAFLRTYWTQKFAYFLYLLLTEHKLGRIF
jgi:hypothetical protein